MFAYLGVGSVSESGAHKRGFLRGFSVCGVSVCPWREQKLREIDTSVFRGEKLLRGRFNCGMYLSLQNINGKTFAI